MRRFFSVSAVLLVIACNSVLDIPEAHLERGDDPTIPGDDDDTNGGDCGDGQKSCNGRCVRNDDPGTGCANDGCEPCALENANATCKAGQCVVATCKDNFGDCDGESSNGCEADLTSDREHCSSCKIACGGGLHCVESTCECHDPGECGDEADGCGTDDNDRGRCYCPDHDGEPCDVGAACDGRECAF